MSVEFHPEARAEMLEAVHFYDAPQPGLGLRFLQALELEFAALLQNPLRAASDERKRRRWRLRKFPYQIIYRTTFVLAIAHNRRAPGYWKSRDPH
jgi:toxin ParE1/3/4